MCIRDRCWQCQFFVTCFTGCQYISGYCLRSQVVVDASDCNRGTGAAYFKDMLVTIAGISDEAHLRSTERHDRLIPRISTQQRSDSSRRLIALYKSSSSSSSTWSAELPCRTRFRHICVQPPLTVGSSQMRWRPSSSQRPTHMILWQHMFKSNFVIWSFNVSPRCCSS